MKTSNEIVKNLCYKISEELFNDNTEVFLASKYGVTDQASNPKDIMYKMDECRKSFQHCPFHSITCK